MARLSTAEFEEALEQIRMDSGELATDVSPGRVTTRRPVDAPRPNTVPGTPIGEVARGIGLASAARDAACGLYAVAPSSFVNAALNTLTLGVPGSRNRFEPQGHQVMQAICGRNPVQPVPEPTPFPQGGCPCQTYDVTVTYEQNGQTINSVGPIQGRIVGTRVEQNASGTASFYVRRLACPGGIEDTEPTEVVRLSSAPAIVATARITSIVPRGSQVCNVTQPIYVGGETNINIENGSPVVDIDLNFDGLYPELNISPTVNFEFNPNVGLQLNFDAPDINIGIDVGGVDINLGGRPPSNTPRRPTPDDFDSDPTDPPPPLPPDIPEEDDGDEDGDRVIRACWVTVTGAGRPATEISGGGVIPSTWAPDLGLVKFKIRTRDGAIGWTEDIRIKNTRQFIVCPWEAGAINVKAFARQGYNVVVTKIFGVAEEIEV